MAKMPAEAQKVMDLAEKTREAFANDVKDLMLKHEEGLLLAGLLGGFAFEIKAGIAPRNICLRVKYDAIVFPEEEEAAE